jgi:aryl-alcohol dehydrogenase (NADP+)
MQKDRYFHDDDFEVAAVAQKITKEHGVTPAQIACAWILQAPGVTAPIIGATKTHHLKQFEAVDIKFSAKEVRALEKPYRPHPILGREQARAAKMLK